MRSSPSPVMPSRTTRFVARAAWIVPVALVLLTVHQARTAVELGRTLRQGEPATAAVTRYERSDRKDVTQAELDLRIDLPDGSTIVREHLALPYSIAHRVEADSLPVRVLRGASQEIVLTDIVRTQIRIAWSNAAMALVMALISLVGVVAWNRMLARRAVPV